MQNNYLESVKKQFQYYKYLGDKTFEQLSDADLFWQFNSETNSIAIIVNHLWGNMLSRWTDFLNSDGEKEWRDRDLEFEDVIKTRVELLKKWKEAWSCLFNALDSVNDTNFDTIIYIRNQGHTVLEAINRQLGHYSYHVGQITFIGKMRKGADWKSLSIPKNQSKSYNQDKFNSEKKQTHFTDEFLNKDKN